MPECDFENISFIVRGHWTATVKKLKIFKLTLERMMSNIGSFDKAEESIIHFVLLQRFISWTFLCLIPKGVWSLAADYYTVQCLQRIRVYSSKEFPINFLASKSVKNDESANIGSHIRNTSQWTTCEFLWDWNYPSGYKWYPQQVDDGVLGYCGLSHQMCIYE